MGLSRRQLTRDFKLTAVRQLEQGIPVGEVARALEVNPNVLHRWRREVRQGPGNAFPGGGSRRWSEGRVAELERKIGRQALEFEEPRLVSRRHFGGDPLGGLGDGGLRGLSHTPPLGGATPDHAGSPR